MPCLRVVLAACCISIVGQAAAAERSQVVRGIYKKRTFDSAIAVGPMEYGFLNSSQVAARIARVCRPNHTCELRGRISGDDEITSVIWVRRSHR